MDTQLKKTKLKVHIDSKGFSTKPTGTEVGAIKSRLQKNASPSFVTLEELAEKLNTGHSISPGIMSGMSAKDWIEQQLFMVDIDNEDDEALLTVKEAKSICKAHNLHPAFYYKTFSNTKEKPKFRLAFIMEAPITSEPIRRKIIETLVNLFPQSDKSCVNADRIFHGTNQRVILLNENARISLEVIEAILSTPTVRKHQRKDEDHARGRSDAELEDLVKRFDLFGYLKDQNGGFRRTNGGVVFKNCDICGRHDNLMYVSETNSFFCHSKNVGGSIIDYLIHTENLTKAQAIQKLKYELSKPEWVMPTPFDEIKLPSFPVHALPSPLCEWVKAVAKSTETPVDMAAVCTLAVLSCALQGKYVVEAKSDYSEPLNLYILLVANSGERKSPIVRLMTEPIYHYEDKENEKRRKVIAEEQAKIRSLQNSIKDAKNHDENAKLMSELELLKRQQTKPLRMIADDVTPEALTSLLADNNGTLTIISTEGGLFDTLAGRYSNTLSIDTILKAYSGDRIRVDRKGRESEVIDKPTLTLLLSAQSNVLEGLMQNDAFKSRGLTARILYSKPKSKIGTRSFETPDLPDDLKTAYKKLISVLLHIPIPQNRLVPKIRLSPKAYQEISGFFDWVEPRLVDSLEPLDGWGEKFIGNTLRISGLLHCVQNKEQSEHIAVSRDTMLMAIEIARYFLEHAKYSYSVMGTDKALHGAKRIIKKLLSQDETELTRYQIHRLLRNEYASVSDLNPSIQLLVEYGYLREKQYVIPTGGRPRANSYLLNPLFFDKKS